MNYFKSILLLSWLGFLLGCEKDGQNHVDPVWEIQSLPSCDDTSAFKSDLDLQPLTYLQDCYLGNAMKEVPGLGSITWIANSRASIGNTYAGISFETYVPFSEYMFLRETLSFGSPNLDVGYHPIDDGYYIRTLADGDVLDASWDIDTTCANFIEITQLDLDCKEVRGKFEIHLIMYEPSSFYQYSERINFINGEFEARIREY